MKSQKKTSPAAFSAAVGVLAAIMMALSYIESTVTALLPLPPGVKPGLANIAVMFACSVMGFGTALLLTIIKAAFVMLISGATAGFISLCGGLASVLVTGLLIKTAKNKLSFTGISILGALFHNAGQTAAACAVIGSAYYIAYFPVLAVSAAVTGAVTGTVLNCVMPSLIKLGLFSGYAGKSSSAPPNADGEDKNKTENRNKTEE